MQGADLHGQDLIAALLAAVDAGDDMAAEAAVQKLAGRVDLLPALRPLLADADQGRRWWAVRTLAVIGGAEAARSAAERLQDPDEATRCAAALALGQGRAAAQAPALAAALADRSGWVRDAAGDALAMIGAGALPALVSALADTREGVRVRAAGALRKVMLSGLNGLRVTEYPAAYWPAVNALFQALNDANRLVRHNAYEALDRLGLFENLRIAP